MVPGICTPKRDFVQFAMLCCHFYQVSYFNTAKWWMKFLLTSFRRLWRVIPPYCRLLSASFINTYYDIHEVKLHCACRISQRVDGMPSNTTKNKYLRESITNTAKPLDSDRRENIQLIWKANLGQWRHQQKCIEILDVSPYSQCGNRRYESPTLCANDAS